MKKWIIRIVLGGVILIVIACVAQALFLGGIVKREVESQGAGVTKVAVKLNGAEIWLLIGKAQLNGLLVGNPPGYKADSAIKIKDLSVQLEPRSFFSRKLIVDSINLKAPEITIEGGLRNNNLTTIQQNVNGAPASGQNARSTPSQPAPENNGQKTFQVNDLLVTGAKLHLDTSLAGGHSLTVPVPDIHLTNLGTGPEGITGPELAKAVMNELMTRVVPAAETAVRQLGNKALGEVTAAAKKANPSQAVNDLKALLGK